MCRGAPTNFSRYTSAELKAAPASFCACENRNARSSAPLHHPHPASAAARRSLQDHGIADLLRQFQRFFGSGQHARRPRQHRHPHLAHEGAGALLDAHHADHLRPRPDELDARGFAHLGEGGVLAQEAVARVDGVHVGDFGGADDGGHVQVAARALGRPDADGLIGEAHVRTVAVRLRIHGDGLRFPIPCRR